MVYLVSLIQRLSRLFVSMDVQSDVCDSRPTVILKAIVEDIRLRQRCDKSAHFVADTNPNLSPINAKLTFLSYVHASNSVVYLFLRQRSPLP